MKKKKSPSERPFSRSDYFTTAELLSRGWTKPVLKSLLPDPLVRNVSHYTVFYYLKEKVLEVEGSDAFHQAIDEIQQKKEKRNKISNQRKQDMEEYFEILLPRCLKQAHTRNEQLVIEYLHRAFVSMIESSPHNKAKGKTTMGKIADTLRYLQQIRIDTDAQAMHAMKMARTLTSMLFISKAKSASVYLDQFSAIYPGLLHGCTVTFLETLERKAKKEDIPAFLSMPDFPYRKLVRQTLLQVYLTHFIRYSIRQDLQDLLEKKPENEYPAARAIRRRFIIHVGPTNSGKTYHALQALETARTGTYLGPLRLLALEVQERLIQDGIPCSMITGEEENIIENATHISSTVEKADLYEHYDVAVIDECQMIGDPVRGFVWTRAILGLLADEIHCCTAPEGLDILKKLITDCGDTYQIQNLERLTPLVFEDIPLKSLDELQPGDAVIAFSKRNVLALAEWMSMKGKPASVIYGRLPYPARKLQIQRFLKKETQYVVATDAIGMGMNLPIKRIIFSDIQKFDGNTYRALRPAEVKQIAGRAGRNGIYDEGFVNVLGGDQDLSYLQSAYKKETRPVACAYLGFSDQILQVDRDLIDVLKAWSSIDTGSDKYKKMDISRYILLIRMIRDCGINFSRQDELSAASIPFEEENDALLDQFISYCKKYDQGEVIHKPRHPNWSDTDGLEQYCKKLDLYYSFSRHFNQPVDVDWIQKEKENASARIHQIIMESEQKRAVHKKKKQKKQGEIRIRMVVGNAR